MMGSNEETVTYGARPCKKSGNRKRKGASDYAAENRDDFTYKSVLREGRYINVLVCKFCAVVIGARSDRIKEHLSSKRHMKLKQEALEHGQSETTLSIINARNKSIAFGTGAVNGDSETYDEDSFYDNPEDLTTYDDDDADDYASTSLTPSTPSPTFGSGRDQSRNELLSGTRRVDTPDISLDFNKLLTNNLNVKLLDSRPFQSSLLDKQQQVEQHDTKYCLSWRQSVKVMKSAFSAYQVGGNFTDVTLASDGRSLKCHKLVLSACSDYFFQLLRDNPCQHPIVILKDTPFWQLEALVKFMYNGEIYVQKDKLRSLIKTANQLHIRGLSRTASDFDNTPKPSRPTGVKRSNAMMTDTSGQSSGGAMLMPIPTVAIKTKVGMNGHSHANGNGMGKAKQLQYYPHLGPTSGGICHEPTSSAKAFSKNATGLQLPTANGEISKNQAWLNNSQRSSQFPSMFDNSIQHEILRNYEQAMKKRTQDIAFDPPITISKIPDVGVRSAKRYQEVQPGGSQMKSEEDALNYHWKNLIPKVEMRDSGVQLANQQQQGQEYHDGDNKTYSNNKTVALSDDDSDSDHSQNRLTIVEDQDN